jgi:hypothetical protein
VISELVGQHRGNPYRRALCLVYRKYGCWSLIIINCCTYYLHDDCSRHFLGIVFKALSPSIAAAAAAAAANTIHAQRHASEDTVHLFPRSFAALSKRVDFCRITLLGIIHPPLVAVRLL